MQTILNFIISGNIIVQMLSVILLLILAFITFSFFLKSAKKSFTFLFDPGSLSDEDQLKVILPGVIEVIVGIILIGLITSLVTNGVIQFTEKYRVKEIHGIIKDAFETHTSINTRKIVSKNNIDARLRMLNIKEAEVRLEIGKEDIVKAIQQEGQLRLRMIKTDKEVVIEDFHSNTSYGSYIDRNSPLTIISTQNYGDAGVGHFTSSVAATLNANYISNEFYSTGAPLKERHVNFANNNLYLDFKIKDDLNDAISLWMNDLNEINDKTSLFVYMGSSNGKRPNDVHVLFGGKEKDGFNVENPKFKNLEKLLTAFENISNDLNMLGFRAATHDEFNNTNEKHLTTGLYKKYDKDVLTLYISTKILWSEDDINYYKTMHAINNFLSFLIK